MQRPITLTKIRLEKAKTKAGGYTKKQLALLGLSWPPNKGWVARLTGTQITLQQFISFVEAGGNEDYLLEIMGQLPNLTPPVSDQDVSGCAKRGSGEGKARGPSLTQGG